MFTGNEHLDVERDGHVVTITMNRPEAKNAWSGIMTQGLAQAWDMVDEDPDIRVAILTGAGGDFCAGADLKSMNQSHPGESFARQRQQAEQPGQQQQQGGGMAGGRWRAQLRGAPLKKPLIAAVEGVCVAGGTEILQATDIRIAGEGATFGVAEARWGLFPLAGSTVRLRRQIPHVHAMYMLLTADNKIPARDAERWGLINKVVQKGQALPEARAIAQKIAANGPIAVQAIKRSVQLTEGLPEDEALAIELEIGMQVFQTEDAREGPMAFAQKRTPEFKGR